jgi:hypothetical protein
MWNIHDDQTVNQLGPFNGQCPADGGAKIMANQHNRPLIPSWDLINILK